MPHARWKSATTLSLACLLALSPWAGGCNRPRSANIELRRDIQRLERSNAEFVRRNEQLRAHIFGLAGTNPPAERLSPERLDELFITAGLKFGRLTRGEDVDQDTAGVERLVVHVVPIDNKGDQLKAAGKFRIRAVDLTTKEPRIREWTFDLEASKAAWMGTGLVYGYVFSCPLAFPIEAESATIEVTFTEALTGASFTEQTLVRFAPRTLPES